MNKKISIKWILMLWMPAIVIGIIILNFILSYSLSKSVFRDHAIEIMENISSYTIDKSRSHLNPARDAALLTSGLAVNQIVTSSKKNEMESYFFEQLLINSQFSNIYYGTIEGEFIMVSRKSSDTFLTKIITISKGERKVLFKESDRFYNEFSRYTDSEDSFDPRTRPWYIDAIKEKKLIWTNPYVFFTSRNPGITTASPVYNTNGSLHGVVGVDIEISELSDFINSMSIGKNGKAFILDSKGQVLAYPDKSKITHQLGDSDSVSLVSIAELDDEVSKAAYNELQNLDYELDEEKEFFFTFKHNNEVYHAMFAPFKASYWPWLLGIYIPENDYLGTLKNNRTNNGLLSLFLGLIIVFAGFLLTRSLIVPLASLKKIVKKVEDGNLENQISIDTIYTELDDTAGSLELMRLGLEDKARLEEQIQQTQKVESIGRLAGGVAHDLNNLLTPILGYSEILINNLSEDEAKKKQVGQIFKAGTKAKDLVHQLLAFSRKQELEYKPLDLNSIIVGFKKLLLRTIREDIDIRIIESEITPVVMADPGQIEQVILNLSVNAQDAMENGGVLTIELSVVEMSDNAMATMHNIKPGNYVLLEIMDTGCGIDKETEKHIYEPFFTTKGEYGIGLGLATVYGIVHQHNGHIIVHSEVGKGTSFKVYLPLSEEFLENKDELHMLKRTFRGSETILVAEDNEQVRVLTQTLLKNLGYNVLIADNGSKALAFLANYDEKVHLLLTDVIMPMINGKELYDKALLVHDELKVLYMSGYSDNSIAHHNVIETGASFIQKPFSTDNLAKKIREVLQAD